MSYNILSGGQAWVNGRDRLTDIVQVCRTSAPDILALQEANGINQPAVAARFAALGLPFHALALAPPYLDGERYHVAVFSRWPLSAVHTFPEEAFESGAVSVQVDSPIGFVSVCNVHLHSTSEDVRLAEIRTVLGHSPTCAESIVTGDFNAISRVDPYPETNGEFENRTEVTDLMHPLVDVFAAQPCGPHWTHPSRCSADHDRRINRRIDYVFASSTLARRVQRAAVIRSGLAHRASDHFPIIVDFV